MEGRKDVYGIYGYFDVHTGECIYIGRDSHIDINRRSKQHLHSSLTYQQDINKWLAAHDGDWYYKVICIPEIQEPELIKAIETACINLFDPPLNRKKKVVA